MDKLFHGVPANKLAPVPGFLQTYIGLAVLTALGLLVVRNLDTLRMEEGGMEAYKNEKAVS